MAVWGLLIFSVLAMGHDGVTSVVNGTIYEAALNLTVRIPGTTNYVCDDVGNTQRGTCPTNWSFITDSDGAPCLRIINTTMSYNTASSFCISLGGNLLTIRSEKQVLPFRFTSNAWIGLWRDSYYSGRGFSWQNVQNSSLGYVNSDDSTITGGYCCGGNCAYLRGSNRKWGATDCSVNMEFICEQKQMCEAGVLGENCDQVCHCYGEACGPDQPCKYGCDQGWMGPYCCTRKRKAEIIYYCVNSATDGRYLLVRINPFGVAYDTLQMVGENGRAVPWCSGTHISRDSAGIYSVKVTVSEDIEEQMGSTCAGNKTGNDTFEWQLSLEEKTGVVLPFDRRLLLSCDFDKAESMTRGHSQDFLQDSDNALEKNNFAPPAETPSASQEEVVLEVIDAFSGKPLSKARLGANVQLQMKLTVTTALMAKGVSPYRCVASSGDGQYTQELTDDDGCPKSIVSELKGDNGTAKTEPFQLFAFPGYRSVVLTCSFQLCFLPHESLCSERCLAWKAARARFTISTSDYDNGYYNGRYRRAATTLKTATTFIYIVTDTESEAVVRSDRPEGGMTSQTMGLVAWALLAISVCVSAALAYVIAAEKRSHLRHHQEQFRRVSSLAERPESTEEHVALLPLDVE